MFDVKLKLDHHKYLFDVKTLNAIFGVVVLGLSCWTWHNFIISIQFGVMKQFHMNVWIGQIERLATSLQINNRFPLLAKRNKSNGSPLGGAQENKIDKKAPNE